MGQGELHPLVPAWPCVSLWTYVSPWCCMSPWWCVPCGAVSPRGRICLTLPRAASQTVARTPIPALTISTTSTSAVMRRWYKNVVRSFFIWMLLSSICATVKIRILHLRQTCEGGRHGHGSAGRASAPCPMTWGPSYLVVPQEEGQQHEHPSVVDDPPDVDVAL